MCQRGVPVVSQLLTRAVKLSLASTRLPSGRRRRAAEGDESLEALSALPRTGSSLSSPLKLPASGGGNIL